MSRLAQGLLNFFSGWSQDLVPLSPAPGVCGQAAWSPYFCRRNGIESACLCHLSLSSHFNHYGHIQYGLIAYTKWYLNKQFYPQNTPGERNQLLHTSCSGWYHVHPCLSNLYNVLDSDFLKIVPGGGNMVPGRASSHWSI